MARAISGKVCLGPCYLETSCVASEWSKASACHLKRKARDVRVCASAALRLPHAAVSATPATRPEEPTISKNIEGAPRGRREKATLSPSSTVSSSRSELVDVVSTHHGIRRTQAPLSAFATDDDECRCHVVYEKCRVARRRNSGSCMLASYLKCLGEKGKK